MLRLRARPPTRPHCSIRFASQLTHEPSGTATPGNARRKPTSILSRLSERTIRRGSDIEQRSPNATLHSNPGHRATSFISARSAQQRDHAAEKWFTDVRALDIDSLDRSGDRESLPPKKHTPFELPKQHEMRTKTDLKALFAPPSTHSAVSLRLQTKKELGGDYTSYLPERLVDPHQFPIDYARLVIGRNKHIPLNAQTGALNIIKEAIQGRAARHVD